MNGTISQGERACWIVHDDRGEFDDGDRVTHFDDDRWKRRKRKLAEKIERRGARLVAVPVRDGAP